MDNETKDKIDMMLLLAYKIASKRHESLSHPPQAEWQKIANIINARFSYPLPPDPAQANPGPGASYNDWKANNHFSQLLFKDTDAEWGSLPLEDDKVQHAIESWNLKLF